MALRFVLQGSVFSPRSHSTYVCPGQAHKDSSILQVIELSDNAIKARGGKALAKALAKYGVLIIPMSNSWGL
jgi:hypothetical protein